MANKVQKINSFSSNEILTAVTILAVLKHCSTLEITKILLIEPLCSYNKLIKKLANKGMLIRSIEELIIKSDFNLANFSKKFEEYMPIGINAIFLLSRMNLVKMVGNKIIFNGKFFNFEEKTLGEKAITRIKASSKLSNILKTTSCDDMYLHLRVEL